MANKLIEAFKSGLCTRTPINEDVSIIGNDDVGYAFYLKNEEGTEYFFDGYETIEEARADFGKRFRKVEIQDEE